MSLIVEAPAETMAKPDLWRARFALKRLRIEQREAIAEVAER